MSSTASNAKSIDLNEEDSDSDSNNAGYGYGCITRSGIPANVMGQQPIVPESDVEESDDEGLQSNKHRRKNMPFGHMSHSTLGGASQISHFGYESDAVSDSDLDISMGSNRRTTRRNSCIGRSIEDPSTLGTSLSGAPRMPDQDHESSGSSDEPGSLLNRATGGYQNKSSTKSASIKPFSSPTENEGTSDKEDDALLYEEAKTLPAPISPRKLGIVSDKVHINQGFEPEGEVHEMEPWRSESLTIPHAVITTDNLKEAESKAEEEAIKEGNVSVVPSSQGVWGDLHFAISRSSGSSSSAPESESDSSEKYGVKMYTQTHVQEEIDMYKQKARRKASLLNTCVDIDDVVEERRKLRGVAVPNFKPADGCTNASDFIVRCFSARLRTTGFTVLKHNQSRWSKSQQRVLYLLPDGKTLTWKVPEGEKEKSKGMRPKLDLTKCKEIRHAWTKDPSTRKKTGTAVLRSKCREGMAGKSFSLIFAKRTLDVTAYSNDQCKVMLEGFSALCFRLQLDQMEKDDGSSNTINKDLSEADWASTVYGAESTASTSMTTSGRGTNSTSFGNTAAALTPWGL
jgi:hypothetical protein